MTGYTAAVLIILSVQVVTSQFRPKPTEEYTHKYSLGPRYYVFWKLLGRDRIKFEVHVITTGWVGFGLSQKGGMEGADVIMGWIQEDGKPQFSDRWSEAKRLPKVDKKQDWYLEQAMQQAGRTVIKFTRKLITCDDKEDIDIVEKNTARIIWAYSDTKPTVGSTPMYHRTTRGTKSIQLIGVKSSVYGHKDPILPPDAVAFDLVMDNVEIPAKETTYWCKGVELPARFRNQPHHVIMTEPVIQIGNEALVHHMIAHQCRGLPNQSKHRNISFDCNNAGPGTPAEYTTLRRSCAMGQHGWAIGGGKYFYPPNVGQLIFGPNHPDDPFFRLELHYDNSLGRRGVRDSSGLRLWLTPTLRPQTAGLIWVGITVNPTHVIPPKVPAFTNFGWCDKSCLGDALPSTGVKVIRYALHTHSVGVAARIRHFRNGREIAMLANDDYYDNNFQESREANPNTWLQKGDELLMECVADTMKRSKPVIGGIATSQEMCLGLLTTVPKIDITFCTSAPSINTLISGIAKYENAYVTNNATHVTVRNGRYMDGTYSLSNPADWQRFSDKLYWNNTKFVDVYRKIVNGGEVDSLCTFGTKSGWRNGGNPYIQRTQRITVIPYKKKKLPQCWNVTGGSAGVSTVAMATMITGVFAWFVSQF